MSRSRLRDGAIVDLHDAPGLPGAPERLLAMMPGLLDVLAARGYAAVPVGELLAGARAPARLLGRREPRRYLASSSRAARNFLGRSTPPT
jgi:hypothetical protein